MRIRQVVPLFTVPLFIVALVALAMPAALGDPWPSVPLQGVEANRLTLDTPEGFGDGPTPFPGPKPPVPGPVPDTISVEAINGVYAVTEWIIVNPDGSMTFMDCPGGLAKLMADTPEPYKALARQLWETGGASDMHLSMSLIKRAFMRMIDEEQAAGLEPTLDVDRLNARYRAALSGAAVPLESPRVQAALERAGLRVQYEITSSAATSKQVCAGRCDAQPCCGVGVTPCDRCCNCRTWDGISECHDPAGSCTVDEPKVGRRTASPTMPTRF